MELPAQLKLQSLFGANGEATQAALEYAAVAQMELQQRLAQVSWHWCL